MVRSQTAVLSFTEDTALRSVVCLENMVYAKRTAHLKWVQWKCCNMNVKNTVPVLKVLSCWPVSARYRPLCEHGVPWFRGPRYFPGISLCYRNTPQVLSAVFRAWMEKLPLLSWSSKGWAATAQYRIWVNAMLGGNNSCDIAEAYWKNVTKNACWNQRKSRPEKCSWSFGGVRVFWIKVFAYSFIHNWLWKLKAKQLKLWVLKFVVDSSQFKRSKQKQIKFTKNGHNS